MAQTQFYRYVGDKEADSINEKKEIKSKSGVTWYTPDRYDTADEAQKKLALPNKPARRVGPIPADEMADFDHCPLRPVSPRFGQPGGGVEAAATKPVWLFEKSVLA